MFSLVFIVRWEFFMVFFNIRVEDSHLVIRRNLYFSSDSWGKICESFCRLQRNVNQCCGELWRALFWRAEILYSCIFIWTKGNRIVANSYIYFFFQMFYNIFSPSICGNELQHPAAYTSMSLTSVLILCEINVFYIL